MTKLKKLCLNPQSLFRKPVSVLLLLAAFMLVAGPALAVEFDVKDTKVTIGGYAKLMMIYDTDGTVKSGPYKGDIAGGYDPPLDAGAGHAADTYAGKTDFRMTARESRFFMKTKTPTQSGILDTRFEADFFGGTAAGDSGSSTWSNSDFFRIRLAYGSLTRDHHQILAGQDWSTFMDLAAGVPDMDIAGDPGFTFVRQGLIRYQYNLRPGHYIAAAIENPDRGLTNAGPVPYFNNAGVSEETMPDFVLKYFYANKTLTLSPRFILRRFDLTDAATGESDSAMAWGAALSSSVKAGRVKFYATFMYGDGLGRYGGLGNIAGAGLTADNKVETVKFMGLNGGLTVALSETVNWTIGAGWGENDDDAYTGTDAVLAPAATKTAKGYHTNVKWAITPALEWAIGVSKYEREVMDGREGSMVRWQSYFKYDF
jgi:hypothetical protein